MSLELILLGLCREPLSGYDLKQLFDVAIRHFWPAELSQVYPTLRRLEARGLLAARREASAKGPPRRVYLTTPAGRAAVRRWLTDGPAFADERYPFAAQVFLLDALGSLDASAVFIRQLRRTLQARLRGLLAVEAGAAGSSPFQAHTDREFHQFLCLRMGLRVLEARIAWCDEALREIRRRKARRPKRGRP
jgi:DNA-binding PadR family transcriptional regulator